jgi:hypothetical protein
MAARALDAEIKNDNRIVAGWLLFYHERKQEYLEQRELLLHSTPKPEGPGSGQTYRISNPTASKAAKLADLQETEKWLALVEEVERRLPWKMQIFLILRRECRFNTKNRPGRPSWVPIVQRRFAQELAARLNKAEEDVWINSPATFHEMWDRIVNYTARLAAKRGLL